MSRQVVIEKQDDVLYADGWEDCLVGHGTIFHGSDGQKLVAIYDRNKMTARLAKEFMDDFYRLAPFDYLRHLKDSYNYRCRDMTFFNGVLDYYNRRYQEVEEAPRRWLVFRDVTREVVSWYGQHYLGFKSA